MKTYTMTKHFKIIVTIENGAYYQSLIYINDNTVKYTKPLTNQSNEQFLNHALTMIGWK